MNGIVSKSFASGISSLILPQSKVLSSSNRWSQTELVNKHSFFVLLEKLKSPSLYSAWTVFVGIALEIVPSWTIKRSKKILMYILLRGGLACLYAERRLRDNSTSTSKPSNLAVDHQYAHAIATATELGIISGDDNAETFRPDEPVNRAEVAKMIVLAWKVVGK